MQVDTLYVDNNRVDPGFTKNQLSNSISEMATIHPDLAKSLKVTENGSIHYLCKESSKALALVKLETTFCIHYLSQVCSVICY